MVKAREIDPADAILDGFPKLKEKGVTREDAELIDSILSYTNTVFLLASKRRVCDVVKEIEDTRKFLKGSLLISNEIKERIEKSLQSTKWAIREYFLKRKSIVDEKTGRKKVVFAEPFDKKNDRLISEGILSNRPNPKGQPIIREYVIPELYDILYPYFETVSRRTGSVPDYPLELIKIMAELISRYLGIDIKEADIKGWIQDRHKREQKEKYSEWLKREL